jgi:NRPS condensation-like uncharacterized protein
VKKGFTGKDMVQAVEANENLEQQIVDFFVEGISFEKGPQLRILCIRRDEGDILCVIISHMVCDGAGFKQYLYILAELYTALKNNKPLPTHPFYPRGTKSLFVGMKWRERMRILRSGYDDPFDSVNEYEGQGLTFEKENREPHMERRKISKEDLAKLKSFAKAHDATLNDVLMALYARAYCTYAHIEKITLPCTMDLRRFMPPGVKYGITNFASMCACRISFKVGDAFTDTLQQISEQMQRHKTGNAILKSPLSWELTVRFTPYEKLKKNFLSLVALPLFGFTNIGIADKDQLHFDNLIPTDVCIAPPVSHASHLLLSASTYDGCCTLCCNFFSSNKDREQVVGILDHMNAEIEVLCKS